MPDSSNFYTLTYGNFANPVLAEIRQKTYGEDIGQKSWVTADEMPVLIGWLQLNASSQILDIGSESGGPALFLARTVGCQVTGLDINPSSTRAANAWAQARGLGTRIHFSACC